MTNPKTMKRLNLLYQTFFLALYLAISSCGNTPGRITLVSPVNLADSQNVITARLAWESVGDSFAVFIDTTENPGINGLAGTVTSPVYNTGRLSFNTTYRWMVRGFRDGRSSDSPVWQFTTAERTNTYGLANEHGVVRNGVGFFELASGNLVMAVDPDTYELLWQYDFKDIYDVAPTVEQKKDGSWLVLEHERANSRVKALYVSDGSVAWISDNNIPYIGGTGFSYYYDMEGNLIVLAKGSNGLHALSFEDGTTKWYSPAQSWYGAIPATDQKNRWIYSQSFERIDRLDAETGKVLKSVYTQPDAMTTHSNTILVNDDHGYFVATANWNGDLTNGNIVVYDSLLNTVWKKDRFIERLSTICYHDGLLYSGQCAGWYPYLYNRVSKSDYKHITAFNINDGSIAWDLDLSAWKWSNIHDIVYCNGYLYAVTDNIGTSKIMNRLLFRIEAKTGKINEVLDFGFPLSICASPTITNGKLFEGGRVAVIGKGDKTDWINQFSTGQINTNEANDLAVREITKMYVDTFRVNR